MPLTVTVIIQQDPFSSPKPVEGLRIALGLSTGNYNLSIILLGKARSLLTEDNVDVLDAEILEKHLPAIQELEIPILVPQGTCEELSLDPDFSVKEVPPSSLNTQTLNSSRVLIF